MRTNDSPIREFWSLRRCSICEVDGDGGGDGDGEVDGGEGEGSSSTMASEY